MNKLSSQDFENLNNIYESLLIEMEIGDVVGTSTEELKLDNEDDYASGDTRIPTLLGNTVQTRNGKIKGKKRRRKSKK